MQLTIDSLTTDTIDMVVSYTIDYQELEGLITAAQSALGTVTLSNSLVSGVTSTRALGSQIARSNALVSSVSTTRTFENQITA